MPVPDSYVASLDVGTTTIRCQIINSNREILGTCRSTVELLYPEPGFVEICPIQLWEQVLYVIRKAISDAKLISSDIKSLGISTQRSTFITWRRDNSVPFHNFITWKDLRAKALCEELNGKLSLQSFRWFIYSLYLVTRNARFLTGSRLKIAPNHVTGRLLWAIQNVKDLKEAIAQNNVMFGTIDTWLLYKFTNSRLHVTDISNASANGFYDPFVLQWGSWAKTLIGIPTSILPVVVDNDYKFGTIDEDIFGTAIPIGCVMADQSSSMYASASFAEDDLKVTLGTGAFLDVNTSNKVHTSVTGMYPLVAWKLKKQVVFIAEAACNDCGSLIQWLLHTGLISTPEESSAVANSVSDNDGVYFIPAFSGLGSPINDPQAGSGFLGIKPTTTKAHLVRAVLESIVFRLALSYETLKKERHREYKRIIVDGGVSNNDFVCQMLSDLTNLKVEKLNSTELSVWGVALVAGLSIDAWNNAEDCAKIQKEFIPNKDQSYKAHCIEKLKRWFDAVDRFKAWY